MGHFPSATRLMLLLLALSTCSGLRLVATRRSALAAGAGALFGGVTTSRAYDALPSAVPAAQAPDPDQLLRERAAKKKEREAKAAKKCHAAARLRTHD